MGGRFAPSVSSRRTSYAKSLSAYPKAPLFVFYGKGAFSFPPLRKAKCPGNRIVLVAFGLSGGSPWQQTFSLQANAARLVFVYFAMGMQMAPSSAKVNWLHTSVGRKVIMAATGLFLMTFLVVHLAGNLLLLRSDGGAAFNAYAEFMSTNPLIRVLEIVLFAGFILHIYQGLYLIFTERRSRPTSYTQNAIRANTNLFSRTMRISALVVLVFLLVHLRHFFVEHRLLGTSLTMYESCKLAFENPFYSAFYVLSMVLLAFHLAHGFYSGFQTLGLIVNRRIESVIKWGAAVFAFLVPLGFAVIPLYFLLQTL